MFYSQLLLSKKGALGIIWMAAHCHKRLKKDQVQQTNISSSVDKILVDEVPMVTHRILAFLLLGVVRIYSKKVEYLFQDCHEILNKLCSSKAGKSARIEVSQRHYHSIIFPRRFELDTFDLGLDQDATGGKVRSQVQDTSNDGCRKGCRRSGSLYKAVVPSSNAYSTAGTPPRDVFEAHRVGWNFVKPSSHKNFSLAGVEVLRQTHFLEDCLEPMLLDKAGKEQLNDRPSNQNASPNFRVHIQEEEMHDKLSHENLRTDSEGTTNAMGSDFGVRSSDSRILSFPSLEILQGIGFALEDRLEPMLLDEAETEKLYDTSSNKNTSSDGPDRNQDVEFNSVMNQSPNGSNRVESLRIPHEGSCRELGLPLERSCSFKSSNVSDKREGHDEPSYEEHGLVSSRLNLQEDENQDLTQAVDNAVPMDPESETLEVIAPESVKGQQREKFQVPVLNPHSTLQAASVGTSEVAAVPTPGRKECARTFKKRKALLDTTTALHNKVLKSWIEEDPTDIKRGRKRTPITPLQAWRAHKLFQAPNSFFEPLLHGLSADLTYLGRRESYAPEIKSNVSSQDHPVASVIHDAEEQIPDITEKSPRQTPDVRSQVGEKSTGQTADAAPMVQEEPPEQAAAVGSPVAEKPTGQTADVAPMVLEESPEQATAVGSPVAESYPNQTPIAPGTPVAYLNSLRSSHEAETIADSNNFETSSSAEQLGLDGSFQEETSSYTGDSLEKGKDIHSSRTRMIASYLSKKFLHQKRREEEVLNLSRLLAGKTKRESTIMFYEILVLKTRDCIDVQQETGYHNILLRETPKLKALFK